jgi:pimeloyl-ACP methyl ester carboxylesterase
MQKRNLLLFHGAIGSKSQQNELANLLTNDFNVFTLDFEGHGINSSEEPFSIHLFKTNVLNFIKSNKLDSVSIFGYSMGGYVALQLAAEYPELVESIFTYGTKFDWNEETSVKESSKLNPEVIEERFPDFANGLKSLHGELNWKKVLHKTAEMMIQMGKAEENQIDFSKIECPCLLSWGTKDKMVTKTETLATVEKIKKSKFFEFENQPHPIEQLDYRIISESITSYFLN